MNLRITTFNLFQYCNYKYSFYTKKEKYQKEQWQRKNNWIKNTLQEIDSHIVAFQEVFTHNDLEKLTKELGFKYFAKIDEAKIKNNIYETCILSLASKFPIKLIQTVQIDEKIVDMFDFETPFDFQRKPLKVTIEIEKNEYIFYVLHLKSNRLNEFEYKFDNSTSINDKLEKSIESFNFKNSTSLKQRLCEAIHISKDILKEDNKNIILLGDLNDKEFSLTSDILSNKTLIENIKDFKIYEEINLKDETFELFDSFKLSNKEKRVPTSYFKTLGNVLDYIFISYKLKENFLEYELFNTHLKDNLNGSLVNSDHGIVTISLKI